MLDARTAFKAGFLARCAQDGLSSDEIHERVKTAQDKLANLLGGLAEVVKPMASVGVPLALAGPPLVGGLAGYGLARATDIDDTDVKEIQDKELLDVYKQESQKLRRQHAVRGFKRNQAQQHRPYYG